MSTAKPKSPVQNASLTGANDPNTPQNAPESARDIDPNTLQRRASTPDTSVWVSASAGTGKTKVLTDRVLRLLLPREDGRPGTPAHKILCLTFTKAAASEMALRLSKTLAQWAVLPLIAPEEEKSLTGELENLLGRAPTEVEIEAARKCFADVIDTPGGLKIMTIHAFCQSILGRFPLESKVSPHFTVMEEAQTNRLMQQARIAALASETLSEPLQHIAAAISEDHFQELLTAIARERSQLQRLLNKHKNVGGLHKAICDYLGIPPEQTPEALLSEACQDKAFESKALREAARTMAELGGKNDKTAAQRLQSWLGADIQNRADTIAEYKRAVLTKDDIPKAKMASKAVCEASPDIPEILGREATRLLTLQNQINTTTSAVLTRDLLTLGQAILETYNALKADQGALDFDDLILKTRALLSKTDISGWIHYKLDQGLDHILVDEAQDTNPEQWEIIEKLCTEFFDNAAHNETLRTVFIVGDEKQSIYSFQRASPAEFQRMQSDFKTRVQNADLRWDSVPMNISFRSVKSVLQAVDAVFKDPAARKGLGNLEIKHTAHRRGQAGLVELWPVFESDEGQEADLWTPLKEPQDQQSGQKKLAVYIAQTIKNWIDKGKKLESRNRNITAGDILILVRTRSKLVTQIARELKNLNIPLSGLDRMVLSEELAVQDLLAAAEFALQPLDDLTLACVLKSPLIGIDEETLYNLAIDRDGESLFSRIKTRKPDIAAYLQDLQTRAAKLTPFTFLSHILRAPCPADEISGRRAFMARLGKDAMDPIDELLSLAGQYEQNETASLQGFIQQQKTGSTQIKREQHAHSDEVRIMTVHGAKGLQAPVVILPDTIATTNSAPNRAEKRLLWPNQTDLEIPLWSPRKDMNYSAYIDAMAALDDKLDQEYRRLLYVAMTRAEDHLYIGGALNKKQKPENLPEGCWYSLIQKGLEALKAGPADENGALRLTNTQTKDPDKTDQGTEKEQRLTNPPAWLHVQAPPETQKSPVFRPSHALETSNSPLKNEGTYRFLRGNLTHKLLQLLPEIPAQKRKQASTAFLERYGSELNADIQTQIIEETLQILENPEFVELFGPKSQAEVPITGEIAGKGLISGQIDRLCITDDEILIIDYKTNRPPPKNESAVPQIYLEQMQTYAAVLEQIYPGRKIKACLLWTDGPILMPLDL